MAAGQVKLYDLEGTIQLAASTVEPVIDRQQMELAKLFRFLSENEWYRIDPDFQTIGWVTIDRVPVEGLDDIEIQAPLMCGKLRFRVEDCRISAVRDIENYIAPPWVLVEVHRNFKGWRWDV